MAMEKTPSVAALSSEIIVYQGSIIDRLSNERARCPAPPEVDLADVYSPGTVELGLELRLSTGVRISRCQHAPSDTTASSLRNVLLTLNLAAPYRLRSRIDGMATEGEVPTGSMVLTPAGSSAHWRWDREVETLHVRFDPVLISEVALEMGHPSPGSVRIAPVQGGRTRMSGCWPNSWAVNFSSANPDSAPPPRRWPGRWWSSSRSSDLRAFRLRMSEGMLSNQSGR